MAYTRPIQTISSCERFVQAYIKSLNVYHRRCRFVRSLCKAYRSHCKSLEV
jgi:hypothetical protein